jgi:hypothetical protein
MTVQEIEYYETRLTNGKESPFAVAEIQIELAGKAARVSEQLKTLRNKKPEFFLRQRTDEKGKKISNERVEMLWQFATKSEEVNLKSDIEILDRFLAAAKACLISLSIESKVQE